jgi:5-formyltetrahydrofolate cyclo-ligase
MGSSTGAGDRKASEKEALRREMAGRLAALDPVAARAAAARATVRALALPELARAGRVLACLSFGSELDTWPLVERLLEAGREIYVPRADPRDGRLHVHRYPCPLEKLSFGLRQPPRGTPELTPGAIDSTLDVVLVLGLAFDRRGLRLGHGRGYFDRFFARHRVPGIGFAYELQLLDRLPAEPHDLPMRVVVTEAAVARPVAPLGAA